MVVEVVDRSPRPRDPYRYPTEIRALYALRPWHPLQHVYLHTDQNSMRRNEYLFDLADWLTDPPTGGPMQMWVVGAGLSAIVSLYGVSCCLAQRATILNITMRGFRPLGRGLWLEITGIHAVTFGLAVMCIGLFIHFQWFWGIHKRLIAFHEFAKYGAAIGLLAAFVAHAFTTITRT